MQKKQKYFKINMDVKVNVVYFVLNSIVDILYRTLKLNLMCYFLTVKCKKSKVKNTKFYCSVVYLFFKDVSLMFEVDIGES